MKKFSSTKCVVFYLSILYVSFTASGFGQNVRLEKKWETPTTLKEPESVLFDAKANVLYVSNINDPKAGKDGNGSIGRISLDGKVLEVEWAVGGMDSPKGLGLSNGLLYIADLKKVAVVDTETGKLVKTIAVKGAGMLNDITVDENGMVYVSDSDHKRIYQIKNDKASVWLEKDRFQKPNGLLAYQNKFYMIDMGTGIFYEIDKKTKALRKIADGLVGGDGIAPIGEDFIISNWNGEIHYVSLKWADKEALGYQGRSTECGRPHLPARAKPFGSAHILRQ
jgi:hypothetical protein